ncbi:proline dehydrogenase family protein [Reichenbachiella carrageenanivorans]|uniref:Proline dehydrogenase family protein n=1 Tax=Reichenbachiella carrageenanivorans TaxID=2979869 RepID=A0ABY6D1N6_9BACT|nr:proline dehydrogenase family protein [Reichenbachiella carrageenanivorans]UXX79515.1 proline dehydrogenase family protein [Reichenbachiella carrageenanivorans]
MMNFDDTQVAFADKSNFDLKRMYFLFLSMNNPIIAKIGIWMTVFALKIHLPIKWMIKKTIFTQFCGGESLKDSQGTVEKLAESHIRTILDYSVEGEESEQVFDANRDEIIRSLEMAATTENIPTGVMKLTGFTAFSLLARKQSGVALSPSEEKRYAKFLERVDQICAKAVEVKKHLFIDAEESWIQDVIDAVVYDMMMKYNQEKVYIFNTYQMYRTASLSNLKKAHQLGLDNGFLIGAKLVRGAYMEKERDRAEEKGYPDPIQLTKAASDADYDAAVAYCIEYIDDIHLCVGTHNENSCKITTELMEKHGISKTDHKVYFAQLYGMSDNLSYTLANEGYNVAKYVPYGPVAKVLPYLMRRAEENTSIAGQSSREFLLVKKEIVRRRRL